ncbi:hypothetical protein C8J55DRAFT_491001 [Lentinula edodes]|uniref:Uncharacterized protein n=1 Tax=Lentinula lateritia TaxID=40482 RepID=A0A9W9DK35_9AGAR|nr:hypothetical protein C8J55DRAFT_491001 [Lentinula edodes]
MSPWNAIAIESLENRHSIYHTSDELVSSATCRLSSAIESNIYKGSVHGLLIGTYCSTPYRVPVPLRAKLCDATISDVDYSPYVYRCNTSGWYYNLADSCHISKFPVESTTYLSNAYTFIHSSNDTPESQNLLINMSALHVQNHNLLWFGNVLVLKHSNHATTGGRQLADLNEEEYWIIKPILEWMSVVIGTAFSEEVVHARLLNMLEDQRLFLGGSAAFWFLKPCSTFKFDNINILAPLGTHTAWKAFFVSLGCITTTFENGCEEFNMQTDSSCHFLSPSTTTALYPKAIGMQSFDAPHTSKLLPIGIHHAVNVALCGGDVLPENLRGATMNGEEGIPA